MPESLLIKFQAGGLQPYLKRDLDTNFFTVNVEEFSKGLVKPIQHFIQHKKMPCWTKCWTGLTEHRNNKKKKKKRKKKIMLDEEKSCWIKIWLRPNFAFNIFKLIQQNFLVKVGANQSKIPSNIFSACLMKCWMKNYVFHMTNFLVCTRSSNIPSYIRTSIHS